MAGPLKEKRGTQTYIKNKAYNSAVFVQRELSTCMHMSGPLGPNLSQIQQANIHLK